MEITPDGAVWFGEFLGGNMARFDPQTHTFKEYRLPGPDPSPYALGVDADGDIWYDSHYMDEIGRFDPRTGKVIEYPFPHFENSHARILSRCARAHVVRNSPNNKVGYFYLSGKDGPRSIPGN